jgi:hypothetical protein
MALSNNIKFVSTVVGVGNYVVSSAVAGASLPESAAVEDGAVYDFYAHDGPGTIWEAGSGAYDLATHTLARTNINATSSNNQVKINWSGAPTVDMFPRASTKLQMLLPIHMLSAQDFNSIVTSGPYTAAFANHPNSPPVGSQWYLEVFAYPPLPGLYVMQRATDLNGSGLVSTRCKIGGTWNAWVVQERALNLAASVMLFQQTAAPTGWTKLTSHNDKALRVVSGAASSGGSNAFSTVMAQTVVGNHTLTAAETGVHVHSDTYTVLVGGINLSLGSDFDLALTQRADEFAGGGNAHNHTILMNMQFVDIILAQKN